jgi:hypothetical protein
VNGPELLEATREMVRTLAGQGFPPDGPWWDGETERFLTHPTAMTWGARVGRGGAKSTALVRLAVAVTVFDEFTIPPGERHYAVIVSENIDEAANRLRLIGAYLDALGVGYASAGNVIDLTDTDLPRGFRVLACRVGAVSGFRAYFTARDEVAKWQSDGVNPAEDVDASMRAMSVTHPNARHLAFSSPVGAAGFHYELVERGDTESQVVSIAPTWIANPIVTEAQTRKLEPNARIWRREYAAIPQAGALAAFDADAVDRAMRPRTTPARAMAPVVIQDPSSGRKDAWTWCLARWMVPAHGDPWLRLDRIDAREGRFWDLQSGASIVQQIAKLAKDAGAQSVHSDQRESLMLASEVEKHGLRYVTHDWTAQSKPLAVERARRWLREGEIEIEAHPKLRHELSIFEEKVTSSGGFTFGARGSGHDDYVALLLTAALAEMNGCLSLEDEGESAELFGWAMTHGAQRLWSATHAGADADWEEEDELP